MAFFRFLPELDPVTGLLTLQRELERAFQSPFGNALGPSGRGVFPPVNVFSDKDGYVVMMEVPGVNPDDLSIEVQGRTLTVSGKREAGVPEQAVLYELGCGWGMLVSALARAFPEARIHGIEISPFPYWVARLRTRHLPNVRLQRGNFFHCDLRDADAVACYLMIKPMPKLAAFLDTMLKQGTPVVSLAFGFRDRQAAAARKVSGLPGTATLYVWPALRRQPSSTQR